MRLHSVQIPVAVARRPRASIRELFDPVHVFLRRAAWNSREAHTRLECPSKTRIEYIVVLLNEVAKHQTKSFFVSFSNTYDRRDENNNMINVVVVGDFVREGLGDHMASARQAREGNVLQALGAGDRESEPHHVRSGRDLQHQPRRAAEYMWVAERVVLSYRLSWQACSKARPQIHRFTSRLSLWSLWSKTTQGYFNFLWLLIIIKSIRVYNKN